MIRSLFLLCLLTGAMPAAQAATVFKCVDAKGKVTFTQQNCPDNHALDDVVSAHNQTPSGSSAPTRMAQPSRHAAARQSPSAQGYMPDQAKGEGASVTVVGGSAERPPCSTGLSDRDLRTAKVRGEIVPGMSRKDVESMYGAPNRDGHAHGAGASTYWNDKYLDQTTVGYDSNGCVRGSYQSGHRN
ncbi:DUF4124 domain-containing protein [Pseudomonas sp. NCHU5208]|uniref:DUF4124 domain-containing protein n=1 Tax=unclassified Pseudomonas TaxID=196821 RepID=UPI003F9970DA